MSDDIRIFLFHRVSESKEKWAHATPISIFEKCVRYITNNFTVKTVEECLAKQGGQSHGNKPWACITFDDGFKDNIQYALPVLEKYKCPASFYIVTDCIDSGLPTWPHLVQNFFLNTNKFDLHIDGIDVKFSSKKERVMYGEMFLKKLLALPNTEAQMLFNATKQYFNDVKVTENVMMNWDDVRQLSAAGYNIGSHTASHPMLTQMETNEKVKYELAHSAERIKEVCGKFPEAIAYPLGVTNEKIMKLAVECGYTYGLTVDQRFYNPSSDNVMAVPRVDMFADSGWLKTYLRLTGHLRLIKNVLGR